VPDLDFDSPDPRRTENELSKPFSIRVGSGVELQVPESIQIRRRVFSARTPSSIDMRGHVDVGSRLFGVRPRFDLLRSRLEPLRWRTRVVQWCVVRLQPREIDAQSRIVPEQPEDRLAQPRLQREQLELLAL